MSATFLERLHVVAERRGNALAIVDGDESITYAELTGAIAQRADQLSAAGVGDGDRVAFVAENSARLLVDAFAVWAVGAVVTTIYPSSGPDDLAWCVEHSDPVLVLVDSTTMGRVVGVIDPTVPVASAGSGAVPTARSGRRALPLLRDRLALICYTSGSTDRPKAVMHSHAGLVGGLDAYGAMWRLGEHDATLVCLPMAWLYGLATGAMGTLLRGGCVVSTPRANPETLVELIDRHRVTVLPGVTTMFVKLVEHLATGNDRGQADLSSLRFCVSGGEPRNETMFDRWAALTGVPIHDTYCSSESFPLITYDPIADPVPRPGSAGRLVPGCELRIVDERGAEVAPGAIGEAMCKAPGLFLGYWRDPERSAAALTADGWFRQQDLVRIDSDGYVHVVGRLSDMIIRGGANVSPAEVERVLRNHPDVADACVVGVPDARYGQRVAAAIVLVVGANDVTLNTSALRAFVGQHLAAYKVPSAITIVDTLPINATTGKVDRRAVADLLHSIRFTD